MTCRLYRSPVVTPNSQPNQIGNRAYRVRRREVADSSVQVQAKLPQQDLVGRAELVAPATFLEQRQVEFLGVAAEDLPAHLNVTIRRDLDRR